MRSSISPEPALLGFLVDRPLHGYDLYKRVRRELGSVWRIEISQMYAVLSSYSTRGWIRARIQSQSTRPAKKMLELTPAGRRAFEMWMQQPARGMREFRVDFFLRLYFARVIGTEAAKKLITQQIASIRREQDELAAHDGSGDFDQIIRDFRIQQSKAIVGWLARHRGQLIRSPKARRVEI